MVKCEVVEKFTLKEYGKLKNIQRKAIETKGELYVGDTFECDEEMAKYLTGGNSAKKVVVKVIEIIPETVGTIKYDVESEEPKVEIKLEKKETKKKYGKKAKK